MDGVETLRDEHRQIGAMAERLKAFLARPAPPDAIAFLHFRREFGRTVTRHLKKGDWMLYPRLKASGRPELRRAATRLCDEIGTFAEEFGAYARRWTSVNIVDNWGGYREETLAAVARLEYRMALEEDELYPLLEGDGALRLAS